MSDVQGVNERNWILTLFIRDDGERFLLGDGAYEFKDSQKHFTAPTITNDDVEVQGADGVLLAGQVRRPTTQEFDGFVGTAAATKEEIEVKRRAFLGFFLARHTYTAIYIFNNGKAIQRRRGFLVDAPEVKELWQIHPEFHVALNFEDVNYYNYAENEQGEEIFSNLYKLINTRATSGGLVWDGIGVVWDELQAGGKNLFDPNTSKTYGYLDSNGKLYVSGTRNEACYDFMPVQENTTYVFKIFETSDAIVDSYWFGIGAYNSASESGFISMPFRGTTSTNPYVSFTTPQGCSYIRISGRYLLHATKVQLELGSTPTSYEPFIPAGGAVWESGSGQNENLITVNSIDTVYPTLTIIGVANNIVIENSRTGDTLEYVGTVASGQTLVIDMQNQTAKLNGVNVLGNITGDWLRLQPGQNRVIYDANTDDTSEATLEWQEIVG